ncbi:MAG: Crp/Fnr family transcriptional regulator [Bacteroidales bacterium]|nr:Crp/Fnr family transcriptional regulator [Bacteroidales bacterium]
MQGANNILRELFENPKSVFSVLSPAEQHDLQGAWQIVPVRKDEFIYKEGDCPAGFIFLITGKVKIFKTGASMREQIVRMTSALGYVGYRALLADEIHNASAVALENSVICRVPPVHFFNRLLKNPDFSFRLLRKLASELGFSNSRTVTLTQKHIRGRLAESLLLLKEKYGFEHDGASLKAYLSREDIARLSNMTTANAIRTLSSFVDEKVITVDGRIIKIIDITRLESISTSG